KDAASHLSAAQPRRHRPIGMKWTLASAPGTFGHVAQQSSCEGMNGRLRPRLHAELVEDVLDVRLDGLLAEVQLAGDLLVGLALGELVEHIKLALRQPPVTLHGPSSV